MDGSTATTTFTVPTNSVMDAKNDPALLCGTTSFALFEDTNETALSSTNWAYITGPVSGVYTITVDTTRDLTLIASQASVSHPIQVRARLDSYTTRKTFTTLAITITQAGCDCSYLAWDNPSSVTASVAVGTPSTQTVPVPTANTGATATVNAFKKCYQNSGTCATTGSFAASTGIMYSNGSTSTTLPSWITYTTTATKTQTIVISPTDGAQIGTHTLIATFTSTYGADPTYTAFVITVTCTVTSFTNPSNPANVSYTLFTKSLQVDLSNLVYVQSPPCGYAYTSTLSWTGLQNFITTSKNFIVDIYSQNISVAGSSVSSPSQTYPLTVANTIAIANNGPAGSSTFPASGTIGFSVTITNPCFTTSLPTLTFNPTTLLSVTDGSTGSVSFVRPINGIESSTNVPLVCGAYAFEVYQDSSDTALTTKWVYIQASATTLGSYDFKVDTRVDATLLTTQAQVDYTVYVKSYLVDYPTIKTYTSKIVRITAATCDCTALAWDIPTVATATVSVAIASTQTIVLPVPNTDARATNAAFDSCYQNASPCATTGSF